MQQCNGIAMKRGGGDFIRSDGVDVRVSSYSEILTETFRIITVTRNSGN